MSSRNFIDHVQIYCRSGKGGGGSVHFHRDKLTAKGGPDGGDGGRGGHIIVRGSNNKWTLIHLRYRKHIKAKDGQAGSGSNSAGKEGASEVLEVPPGTQIKEKETGKLIFEIKEHGEEKILLNGGDGGMGNSRFKTSTKQAPRHAQSGGEAEEGWFIFELKLLADAGLIGYPNAGKSTLLSVLSAAKPEIADYPFTTMTPQLGVVSLDEEKSFVLADLPGIIEDAHKGKGLGDRFLRHIERSAVLLFVISPENLEVLQQYEELLKELHAFDPSLMLRERLIVINKSDLLDDDTKSLIQEQLRDHNHVFVSAIREKGLEQLKEKSWKLIQHATGLSE